MLGFPQQVTRLVSECFGERDGLAAGCGISCNTPPALCDGSGLCDPCRSNGNSISALPPSTPEEASVREATLWPFPFPRKVYCTFFGRRRRRSAPDDATLITGRRAGRSLSGLHLLVSHPPSPRALSVIVKTKQQILSGGERAGGGATTICGAALCDSK